MQIAIDGPAGSGKSSVAKIISEELDFFYLDTGSMYRGITLFLEREHINPLDEKQVLKALENLVFKFKQGKIYLNNEDVSDLIRENKIAQKVSLVAAQPGIRKYLVKLQQAMAQEYPNVILDGRDIGTVVLPNAEVKIYLEASLEERAKRRYQELLNKGEKIDFQLLKEEMFLRDKLDLEREHGPLLKSKDAIVLNTDFLSLKEVVREILNIISNK